MKVSREQAAQNRERIVEAAAQLFRERGFDGIGVADLMKEAGLTHGGFYSYFKSKEEFALAVLEEYWSGVENRFGGILLDSSLSPVERITRYFRLLSDDKAQTNFAHGCLIGNLSLEIANASAQVRSKLSDIFERWEAPIIRCLREAQEVREIAPAGNLRDLAAAIIESWEGAAMRAKVEQNRRPYRRFEKVILPGILKT